ncbi:MAG: TIGR04283 family arsenosugar biosynthesis glycosyltransferase [Magnetococcales bacterium]|nr:TIGR04283 family arsenosugar biosynthesis glycosyltransferase [Magnetococcales bacterium]
MTAIKLSIIIPVLNDARELKRLLEQLAQQTLPGLEVLVADGGSTDDSVAVAQNAGAHVVTSEPGRGRQMNAAAQVAQGEHWLFLHADSTLPHPQFLAEAWHVMAQTLANHPRSAGHFSLHFCDSMAKKRWYWPFWEKKTLLNRAECIHGDQGLWITRHFFTEIGGFDTTYPFLEERRVAQEVTRLGQWILLPGHLGTSTRRFDRETMVRRTLLNALIMVSYEIGHYEFLQHAPDLYRQSHASDRLKMTPFFHLLQSLIQAMPPDRRQAYWRAAGVSLRHAFWQLFFLLDVLSSVGKVRCRFACYHFYRKHLEPWSPRWCPDLLASTGARLVFHGLRLYFLWSEGCR